MSFFNRYEPLPLERQDFRSNEIPVTPDDIQDLYQAHGEEVAENVRIAVQQIRSNGGINPNGRNLIYPQGVEKDCVEPELLRIVSNFALWYTFNHEPQNYSRLVE